MCLRIAAAVAKHLYVGLVYLGSWHAPLPTGEFLRQRRSRGDPSTAGPARRPCPGHPERLVPDIPLSDEERRLWRAALDRGRALP